MVSKGYDSTLSRIAEPLQLHFAWTRGEMAVAVHGRRSSPAKLRHTKPVAQHENDEHRKERSGGAFAEVLHNRPPSILLLFLKVVRPMND